MDLILNLVIVSSACFIPYVLVDWYKVEFLGVVVNR